MLWLPFLPASNLLFRVGFVIAERVMYHLRDTQLPWSEPLPGFTEISIRFREPALENAGKSQSTQR
eukprot:COSAG01_NODE_50731_length_361_cov_0.541985_1_plen_65_part_01